MVDGELDLALSPVLLKVYMSKSIKKKRKKKDIGEVEKKALLTFCITLINFFLKRFIIARNHCHQDPKAKGGSWT